MMNGLNGSFWDGLGVEIEACANFDPKTLFWGTAKNYGDWMRGDGGATVACALIGPCLFMGGGMQGRRH